MLTELCVEIYETDIWPEDFNKVAMNPIQKKGNAGDCAESRSKSFIAHAAEILDLLKIIIKCLETKTEMLLVKRNLTLGKAVVKWRHLQ